VAVFADETAFTSTFLFLEPLWLALLCLLVLHRLAEARLLDALALGLGSALALGALHAPAGATPTPPTDEAWAGPVARCGRQVGLPTGPLRLLWWELAGASVEGAVELLIEARPDLVVLGSPEAPEILSALKESLGGESQLHGDASRSLGLWARGAFQYCGRDIDSWTLSPEEPGSPTAPLVVLTFPKIQGVGLFPFLAFSSGATPLRSGRALETARGVASGAGILGDTVIAAGHLGVPASARRSAALFRGAGLRDPGGPPTWPGRLGPLPGLTLHRLDRVLAGAAWTPDTVEVLPARAPNLPLLVRLTIRGQGRPVETP
jgi:hypothetical protein